MSIAFLWPYLGIGLVSFLFVLLFNQKGEIWKERKFWISWVILGLTLVGLLLYIVLRALKEENM